MKEIRELVENYLQALEARFDITVLYACLSGSRAWGTNSPKSDWDIRFLYLRPTCCYLWVNPSKSDTLDFRDSDAGIEMSGWDFRKALSLLGRSNPNLLEWLRSPEVYCRHESIALLFEIFGQYFNSVACFHHYLGMAKKYWGEIKVQGKLDTKLCLNALRSSFCCSYIQDFGEMPPLYVGDMPDIKKIVFQRRLKGDGPVEDEQLIRWFHRFMETSMEGFDRGVKIELGHRKPHIHKLNELFLSVLTRVNRTIF